MKLSELIELTEYGTSIIVVKVNSSGYLEDIPYMDAQNMIVVRFKIVNKSLKVTVK